jgi:hypothetical protein
MPKTHLECIKVSLCLYFFAAWTSMAAMELFGWLTFALTWSYAYRHRRDDLFSFDGINEVLPWKALLALMSITIVGIFVNGTAEADKVFIIGSQRWMLLLLSGTLALALWPPTLKGYRVFLVIASVIAAYAVFQSFTGIDLVRPGSHRAVQGLPMSQGSIQLWRSAGTFGSPMGYVYIAGMYACLPLAVALVFPKSESRLRRYSIIAFCLIAASLITTYVRGAWIAMAVAYLVMAGMVSRRFLFTALATGATAFALMYATLAGVRERFQSLFDMQYSSNSERLFLWKMNLEMFKDYPLLGIGYGENESRAGEYAARMGHPDAFTGHAHNNYLQMLAGTGLAGFVAYMFFILFFIYLTIRLWRRLPKEMYWARALTLAALGAQIHLHIGGFTECNFKAGATNHNLMLVLALVASLSLLEIKGLLKKGYKGAGTA